MNRFCAAAAVAVLAGLFVVPTTSAEATGSHRRPAAAHRCDDPGRPVVRQLLRLVTRRGRHRSGSLSVAGDYRPTGLHRRAPDHARAPPPSRCAPGATGAAHLRRRRTHGRLRARAGTTGIGRHRRDGLLPARRAAAAARARRPWRAVRQLVQRCARAARCRTTCSTSRRRPPALDRSIIPTTGLADRPVIFDRLNAARTSRGGSTCRTTNRR